jgi:putative hemolysin
VLNCGSGPILSSMRVLYEESSVSYWSYVGLAITVLISCFYSATYFSLRNFSRIKLEELFTQKNKTKRFNYLLDHLHNLLLMCSIVRTSANLALVTIMVWVITQGDLTMRGLIEAFVLSLFLLSIFSVAFPHALARYAADKLLAYSIPALYLSEKLSIPFLGLMHAIDVLVRRLSGASLTTNADDEQVQQDILEAVQEGEDEGVVDTHERKMIESVIELRTTMVGQVMTPRTEIVAIDAGSSLEDVKRIILDEGHSRMPIYEDNLDNIIGMLYVKDLLPFIGLSVEGFDLRKIMRQCYFVPETKPLREIFSEFRNKKLHVAIVLDEYGGTLGLVTFEDVLEQIVGQIGDEYETSEPPLVRRVEANILEIDGRTRIDALNDEYALALPESEDYETISGFLFSSLGRIPAMGETFQYRNLLFSVLDATERKINTLRLEILPTDLAGVATPPEVKTLKVEE